MYTADSAPPLVDRSPDRGATGDHRRQVVDAQSDGLRGEAPEASLALTLKLYELLVSKSGVALMVTTPLESMVKDVRPCR